MQLDHLHAPIFVFESGFHRGERREKDKYAICLYDPAREKAVRENPQIFPNCKLENILSAEYAQSKAEGIQNRFYCPIPASCSYSCAAPPPGYFTLTKALFRMHTPSEYTVSRNF